MEKRAKEPHQGDQEASPHEFGVDITEIYSPPRVTKMARSQNGQWRIGGALDLTTGYNFCDPQCRADTRRQVKEGAEACADHTVAAMHKLLPFETVERLPQGPRDGDR